MVKAVRRKLEDYIELSKWAAPSIEIMRNNMNHDAAHDESHILRVLRHAILFAEGKADLDVLIPAVLLHDLVNVPKNSPCRKDASKLSAMTATRLLQKTLPLKDDYHRIGIEHAIIAHSYSAGVMPETLEAKCLSDADKQDALGHIGVARLFATGGTMNRALFDGNDPLAQHREADEQKYTLDHYLIKLHRLPGMMHTRLGRMEAESKLQTMSMFMAGLMKEIVE